MEQLFKRGTIKQRKIMEWLIEQGITGADIAHSEFCGSAMVRITNPAGQYMDLYCDGANNVRILDVLRDREEELAWFWGNETNDPETEAWRDELTADETAMVEQWDRQSTIGFQSIAKEILDRKTRLL